MSTLSQKRVLVTGGSGFLGAYCIIELLNGGYQVNTTIRSLAKAPSVKVTLKAGGISESLLESVSFFAADLNADQGWTQAISGCTYILHTASPFPASLPTNEDEVIRPAREGSLRVLKAAKAAGVKRVVLTSSFAAIAYGHPPQSNPFTEKDWTITTNPSVTPYEKSKALAERAAWDFIHSNPDLEMSVVNPVGILGPVIDKNLSTSTMLIQRLLNGTVPGCANLEFGLVDVRDVASLHVLAMTASAAAGERFIGCSPPNMSVQELAITLKTRVPDIAKRTKTRLLPDWLIRLVALFDKEIASHAPMLSKKLEATNEKAEKVLGWKPRSKEDAIVATAESMFKLGLIKESL